MCPFPSAQTSLRGLNLGPESCLPHPGVLLWTLQGGDPEGANIPLTPGCQPFVPFLFPIHPHKEESESQDFYPPFRASHKHSLGKSSSK